MAVRRCQLPRTDNEPKTDHHGSGLRAPASGLVITLHSQPSPVRINIEVCAPQKSSNPSFDRFSLSMASTGCRHGATARPDLDKIDQFVALRPHRKCVRMLHPLLKNVFSSRLVSTLAITTHAPRCCEDCARLVADTLATGKEPKEARRGCAIAKAIMGRRRTPAGLLLALCHWRACQQQALHNPSQHLGA